MNPLLVGTLALGAALLTARRALIVATVDGSSMEPALHCGDRVLVRRTRRVRPGVVALLRPPASPAGNQTLLKRVVAGPGDRLPSDWSDIDVHTIAGSIVPPGAAVVLGDNRATSWDSRHYGFVAREQLIGVVAGHLTRATR